MEKFCPTVLAEVEKEFFGKRWQIKVHKYLALILFVAWLMLFVSKYFLSASVFGDVAGIVFLVVIVFGLYISTYHPRMRKEWNKKKEELYRKKVLRF